MFLLSLLHLLSTMLSFGTAAPPDCPDAQLSCHNTTTISSCCLLSPGGQLLQTQFWDSNLSTDLPTSWTIHGLWPDNRDGTNIENCDSSRAYKNISAILQAAGNNSLVEYMQTYWISNDETTEKFWENEWSEHGTCVSTLNPTCYTQYQPQEEVVDYFTKVVSLFKSLKTYQILSNAGIVPSTSQTYQFSEVQAALSRAHNGKSVIVTCESNVLSRVGYPFEVIGSFQTGTFQPADYVGGPTNCPEQVSYQPKISGTGGGGENKSPNIEDVDYRDEL